MGAGRALDLPERSLLCPVVIGRDRELTDLAAAVDALPGRGGVAVIAGEAGVGKTRLMREAAAVARERGITVLSGRAAPGATPVPYRPLTEAFISAFRGSRPTDAPELAGFGGQLGRLVPEWRSEAAGGADESPVLLGEAVVRLLSLAAGDRGCVLLLEDLHWADAETLTVVEYLADALHDAALCIVTARVEGAAVEPLARLRRHSAVTVLGLSRLQRTEIDRVVAACLSVERPPPEVVDSVAANSEGNPFLIEELLAGLVASGALQFEGGRWTTAGRLAPSVPFDFAESMRQRLRSLDDAARTVLRAAALLGRRFDWELLPALADVDGRAVVDALRVAVDEQLVEVDGEVFRFRHALTREAVLSELLPPERRDLARRALPAVERAHPGLPGEWCERAADLAEEAGDHEAAVRHLVESARRALDAGALMSGEETARRARRLAEGSPSVDDADELLVQILAAAGKPEDAAAVGEALVARLASRPEAEHRHANTLVVLARAALAAGDAEHAAAMIQRAQDLAGDDAYAARIEAVVAHVALAQDRLDDASASASAAIDLAQRTSQPAVECEALEVLGRIDRYSTDADAGVRWFQRAADLAERHGLTTWRVRARHEIALMTGYLHGDIGPMRETRELAAQSGALVTVAVMDLAMAEIGLSNFDREMCIESGVRCVDASTRYGLATLPVAHLWLAGGYALAEDVDAMEASAARALAPDPDDPRILGDLWGRVRATSSIVRDDAEQLRRDLDSMMTYARVAPIATSIFPNRVLWGLIHAMEDDDLGASATREIEAASHMYHWPIFGVCLDAMKAVALGRQGRSEEATALYASAEARRRGLGFDEGSVRYFETVAAEAAIRDGWGDPAAPLRRAEAFFAERGYDRIVRRCRRLLAEAGAPVPRRGRGDSEVPQELRAMGVTSRELDVLKLVADGLSNKEVAERLVLSPKTVERHLSSLFDRTGRRTRGELAGWYHALSG